MCKGTWAFILHTIEIVAEHIFILLSNSGMSLSITKNGKHTGGSLWLYNVLTVRHIALCVEEDPKVQNIRI